MHPRISMIVLAETLDLNPPKSRISVIQGAVKLLQLISSNQDGCTFLRTDIDKRYLDIISRYLTPYSKNLGLGIQHNSLQVLYITNITQATFQELNNILQKELLMEKLVKKAETRVEQSYKKIIDELKQENQSLLQLLAQNKPTHLSVGSEASKNNLAPPVIMTLGDEKPRTAPKPTEVKAQPLPHLAKTGVEQKPAATPVSRSAFLPHSSAGGGSSHDTGSDSPYYHDSEDEENDDDYDHRSKRIVKS